MFDKSWAIGLMRSIALSAYKLVLSLTGSAPIGVSSNAEWPCLAISEVGLLQG
jgi:hypothetical protein